MEETEETQVKKPINRWGIWATLLFVLIGVFFCAPCMCINGHIYALSSSALLAIITARLAAAIIMRTFTFKIYFIWVGGFFFWQYIVSFLHSLR